MSAATMKGPIFKVLDGPSHLHEGVGNAVTAGLSPILSSGSKAADLLKHDRDGLLTMLTWQVGTANQARIRARWFGGRLYNRCSGDDPDYVPMSGTHLRQVMDAAGIDAPHFVVAAGRYALRYDIARAALAALRVPPGEH